MLLMLVNTRIGKVLALWLRIEAEENIVALLLSLLSIFNFKCVARVS